eukprot:TRINITY_DN3665_c0_g1_i2.p4 TRINITY_DN3665_c0_g1~~TRINITY_DN3665_c0_g1_i2.p4  ORF type:complete len:112 (+),score=4.82 TRINITY_DN3665_c0_g1_i2:776-1111(+)
MRSSRAIVARGTLRSSRAIVARGTLSSSRAIVARGTGRACHHSSNYSSVECVESCVNCLKSFLDPSELGKQTVVALLASPRASASFFATGGLIGLGNLGGRRQSHRQGEQA